MVDAAPDGITGLHLAITGTFDAIVLDLGLPGIDGLTLCQKLRDEAHNDTPMLMLTARDTVADRLEGFARGTDDYLVKPFALMEVEARLAALHKRRVGRVAGKLLSAGDLVLDPFGYRVHFRGNEVKLPPKCIRLLETLMAEPDRLFTRKDLETALWGNRQQSSDALRSHMHILRRELARAGGYDPIENLHGLGYRLVPRAAA